MGKSFQYYRDFTNRVYNFLNGQINPDNISKKLNIKYSHPDFGGFNDDKQIYIFVNDIVKKNKFYKNPETAIIYFVAHELTHLQYGNGDIDKYNDDIKYNYKIEYITDFNTYTTLLDKENLNVIKEGLFPDFDDEMLSVAFFKLVKFGITNNYDEELHKDLIKTDLIPDKIKSLVDKVE